MMRRGEGAGAALVTASADMMITDLSVNDHACLTFGDPEELVDLTAAFIRDGLAGGLKVVWLIDAPPQEHIAKLAKRGIGVQPALEAGQLKALACEDSLLPDQAFAAGHAMTWLNEQVAASKIEGFRGVRVALDMSWALRPVAGVEQLPSFEESMGPVMADTTVSVLCQYDRERFDPVTLASVTGLHNRSVAAATYYQDAMLRICRQYAPPGIRLAGEIDYRAEEPLALALAEALRIDGDITVNMSGLTFIDAPCMRMILKAGRGLALPRKFILQCPASIAETCTLFGIADSPSVILVTVDDR